MPKNLTDVSNFDSPVSVPVDTDVANAASVEGPFQQLADRTKFLKDKYGGSGYVLLNDGAGNHPQFVRYIGAHRGHPQFDSGGLAAWYAAGAGANALQLSRVDRGTMHFPLIVGADIASAGKILSVEVEVKPGVARATAGNRMFIQIRKVTFASGTWTDTALDVNSGATDAKDDGTVNEQPVDLSVDSAYQAIDATAFYYVRVDAGSDGATNQDQIGRVLVLGEWNNIP